MPAEKKINIALAKQDGYVWLLLSFYVVAMMVANLLITISIAHKNASLSSLIEITYPFFIIMFSWVLFREMHMNLATSLGAVLIFAGVAIIYLKG